MNEEIAKEVLAAMREIVRRAILTMAAIPDPDAKFMGYAALPQNVVHDVKEAYGYSPPRTRQFVPSSHDISQLYIVMPWLAWLRREYGEDDLRRINAWAMGVEIWRLAQKEGRSEKTIQRRIDASIGAIVSKFGGADLHVEIVDEQDAVPPCWMITERAPGPHGHVKVCKVYVSDLGFVKNGKVWRDGSERARRYA